MLACLCCLVLYYKYARPRYNAYIRLYRYICTCRHIHIFIDLYNYYVHIPFVHVCLLPTSVYLCGKWDSIIMIPVFNIWSNYSSLLLDLYGVHACTPSLPGCSRSSTLYIILYTSDCMAWELALQYSVVKYLLASTSITMCKDGKFTTLIHVCTSCMQAAHLVVTNRNWSWYEVMFLYNS